MQKFMTYQDVATQLDLSVRYIAKLVGLNEIPFVKIGKAVRFDPSKIEKWVENKSNSVSGSMVSMRRKLTIVKI